MRQFAKANRRLRQTSKRFFALTRSCLKDFQICFGVRTVPTAALATVAAPQMIVASEDHQTVFKIKIAGQNLLRRGELIFLLMKCHHAFAADTGFVAQVRWHLRDQFVRYFYFCAPARPFIGTDGAELAIIWLIAQWTIFSGIHFSTKISERKRPTNSFGIFASMEFVSGFSKSTWPSQNTTFAFFA